MNKNSLTTVGLAVLRIALGLIFAAHGWQKFNEWTIAGTTAAFGDMGIPMAGIAAPLVATVELVGGIALILGVLSRPVALLLALDMIGALLMVHLPFGMFVANNGVELVLALGAGAAAIALIGPGAFSVDKVLFGRTDSKARVLAA
ncbi:DoxX family protein [Tessaracoccus oleiagri]|uniref:Putative oxidoreductase n=1 Tax=Tessaracoccus oleiagri TaxID=686624 RepID=A0A1G9LLJ2_9ACTN|nr:DoxX family protein [Tessaracoccus oleiagri]SDL62842.1 putative oxidoreductase [Tessaracoccus oleiagri]